MVTAVTVGLFLHFKSSQFYQAQMVKLDGRYQSLFLRQTSNSLPDALKKKRHLAKIKMSKKSKYATLIYADMHNSQRS